MSLPSSSRLDGVLSEADECSVGLLAGVGVLTRTMVGELCDKTNRVEGMSLQSLFGLCVKESDNTGFAVFTPALTVGFTLG